VFVWIGIDVNDAFAELRKKAVKIEKTLECEHSCYTLPMHISLKMSFAVQESREKEIENNILEFLGNQNAIEVVPSRIENAGNIVWVRYEQNERLCRIKDELNAMLGEKYGVVMHEYDSDYLFHTTVFMFDEQEKNAEAFRRLGGVELPNKIVLDKFVVGSSSDGKLGTYVVRKEVSARK